MALSARFSSTTSIVETRFTPNTKVECLVLENGADIIATKEVAGRTVALAVHRRDLDGKPFEFAVWTIDANGGAHTGEYSRDIILATKAFSERKL